MGGCRAIPHRFGCVCVRQRSPGAEYQPWCWDRCFACRPDYLGHRSLDLVDWRFVEQSEVLAGLWSLDNNLQNVEGDVETVTPNVGRKNWNLYLATHSSAGLARDTDAERACLERGVNAYSAGKILGTSFAGRLRAKFYDVHFSESLTCCPFIPSSYFLNRLSRYASSGPPFLSYASWATSTPNGSVYRAMGKGPASTESKPTPRISSATTPLPLLSSPHYNRLGRLALRLASYPPKSTSLGTLLNAATT